MAGPVVQDTVSETFDVTHAVPVSVQAENVLLIWGRASGIRAKKRALLPPLRISHGAPVIRRIKAVTPTVWHEEPSQQRAESTGGRTPTHKSQELLERQAAEEREEEDEGKEEDLEREVVEDWAAQGWAEG